MWIFWLWLTVMALFCGLMAVGGRDDGDNELALVGVALLAAGGGGCALPANYTPLRLPEYAAPERPELSPLPLAWWETHRDVGRLAEQIGDTPPTVAEWAALRRSLHQAETRAAKGRQLLEHHLQTLMAWGLAEETALAGYTALVRGLNQGQSCYTPIDGVWSLPRK